MRKAHGDRIQGLPSAAPLSYIPSPYLPFSSGTCPLTGSSSCVCPPPTPSPSPTHTLHVHWPMTELVQLPTRGMPRDSPGNRRQRQNKIKASSSLSNCIQQALFGKTANPVPVQGACPWQSWMDILGPDSQAWAKLECNRWGSQGGGTLGSETRGVSLRHELSAFGIKSQSGRRQGPTVYFI